MTATWEESILLDTNGILHIARDNDVGRAIARRYRLFEREPRPLISSVTLGEARGLVRWRRWGARRIARLDALLDEFTVISAGLPEVITEYVRIKVFTLDVGHTMSDNDLWIAATCVVTNSRLITSDKDSDRLHPDVILRDYIHPA